MLEQIQEPTKYEVEPHYFRIEVRPRRLTAVFVDSVEKSSGGSTELETVVEIKGANPEQTNEVVYYAKILTLLEHF